MIARFLCGSRVGLEQSCRVGKKRNARAAAQVQDSSVKTTAHRSPGSITGLGPLERFSHQYWVKVDSGNAVPERDETHANNVATAVITVFSRADVRQVYLPAQLYR